MTPSVRQPLGVAVQSTHAAQPYWNAQLRLFATGVRPLSGLVAQLRPRTRVVSSISNIEAGLNAVVRYVSFLKADVSRRTCRVNQAFDTN